ncbi:DUF5687 family protein [Rhodohalobacter sp. 8-1]|uniref:DUF5687 family protein n=1 Tax=Rhodohalobacter sp. 8-1 TaxID=3131972 RepID=UPI0030EE511F
MTPEFIRLLVLEKTRSLSFGRDIVSSIFTLLLIAFILFYLVGIAVFLGLILKTYFGIKDIPSFLNTAAIYYLAAEFVTRIFLQKKPLFDLARYLHLPIKRSGIVHYLLGKSVLSTFSVTAVILFLPITITELATAYGALSASLWLGTLVALSLSLHWLTLWTKETVAKSSVPGLIAVLTAASLPFVLLYFNLFNLGLVTAPFFSYSLSGPLPLALSLIFFFLSYRLIHRYYSKNAYLDQAVKSKSLAFSRSDSQLFNRFGAPGVLADIELKLILRHKKSRGYLAMSALFLLYGLLFYEMPDTGESFVLTGFHLFLGIFITGIFFVQYAQFFLSWNSSFFDFFMVKNSGLRDLVRGKILLLSMTTVLAYILSLPYLYFGWQILLVHTAGLLFNLGFGIHIIVMMALWEPKPIDINKGAMFNYDGIGISQFLMVIPLFLVPYLIYIPVHILFDAYSALAAVCLAGITGLLFHKQLINVTVNILDRNRHKISSSFRRGT